MTTEQQGYERYHGARPSLPQDLAAMQGSRARMRVLSRRFALPATVAEPPMRTSQVLRDFADSLKCERVSVGEIVAALGDRGLGVLIALFAIPNVFPSTVPFGNVLTGVPVIVFAVQLMLGVERTILPGIIARRTISTSFFKAATPRVAGLLAWFERLLKPRLDFMTTPRAERAIGIFCMILSVISTLPIPFAHQLPALAIMLIGLGLIERDGLAMLSGALLGMAGLIVMGLLVLGLVQGAKHAMHSHMLHRWMHRIWRKH